ncbi:MAG: hypothetical protein KDK89_03790 [Alphaproteobacteria bacterium]|nr:hypothetical protein [Alphaproteobacteria bacterium]
MKKIALSLVTLAALSSAAFAFERTDIDPRDRNWSYGSTAAPVTLTSPFAVEQSAVPMTNFERLTERSIMNLDSHN